MFFKQVDVNEVTFKQEKDSTKRLQLIKQHSTTLPVMYDSFYEEVVLFDEKNTFLSIQIGQETIGFFIINETQKKLYSFYLHEKINLTFPSLKKQIFERLLKHYEIETCMAYTIDYKL
eukprot:gene3592-6327_t